MPEAAAETAYYLNSKIPQLALIAKGVRFPAGRWMRIAPSTLQPWLAERLVREMFPALLEKGVAFAVLLNDSDVVEFERGLPRPE